MGSSKKSVSFSQETNIPPLTGKVIIVTGGNAGLGKQTVLDFARHRPRHIWLASRSLEKAKLAADEIKQQIPGAPIKLLQLDLSSFASIKKAAETFLSESDRLDVLMLNAGIMAAPAGITEDGYELQFGTNHMGHALLTKLLLPIMNMTADTDSDVRIVSVTSNSHRYAPKGTFEFDTLKTPAEALGAYPRYFRSKLANVLWARQLAKLHPRLTIASVNPGIVQTQLLNGATGPPLLERAIVRTIGSLFGTSLEQGVRNQLWAAVSVDVQSGEYYEPVGIAGKASANGTDDELAHKVWEWTEKELNSV